MSFKLKTVLGVAAIEILLLAILVFSGLHYLKTSNEARIFEQAHVSARLLATMTADATVAWDLATLDELVNQAARNSGIIYARIRSADGKILSQSHSVDGRSTEFVEDLEMRTALEDGVLDVFAPIQIDGRRFARVELGVSTDELSKTVNDARDWMLSIAATEIVLVAIFGLLLGSLLTRQLYRLQKAARRVAGGEFGFETPVVGEDELAQTAASFNEMSRALKLYKAKFEEALEAAEEKRAKAESRLYAAIEALPLGIVILNSSRKILHANRGFLELYGLWEELLEAGKDVEPLLGVLADRTRQIPYESEKSDEVEKVTSPETALSMRARQFDGATVSSSWETQLDDGRIVLSTVQKTPEGGYILVDTDITTLHETAMKTRQLEADLLNRQKLESLGTLAAGVAHEINNPTQFVGDNLRFAKDSALDLIEYAKLLAAKVAEAKLATADELEAMRDQFDIGFIEEELPVATSQALEGVNRIRGIVSAIRIYAHPDDVVRADVNVTEILRNAVIVTTNKWRSVAEIEDALDDSLSPISGNPGQLGQVFVNLLVNATDAIEERGKAEKSEPYTGKISLASGFGSDGRVYFDISDNGNGIPTEIRERVFDPFFTTKPKGVGTGQGLAICKSIIADTHAGRLTFHNNEFGGTTFRVELPGTSDGEAIGAGGES